VVTLRPIQRVLNAEGKLRLSAWTTAADAAGEVSGDGDLWLRRYDTTVTNGCAQIGESIPGNGVRLGGLVQCVKDC